MDFMTTTILESLLERTIVQEKRFEEVRKLEEQWEKLPCLDGEEAFSLAAAWIAAQCDRIGASGCVFGASGGVDSSLVAVLLHRALPDRTRALIMPCHSSSEDEADARRLLEVLRIPYDVISLDPAVDPLLSQAPEPVAGAPSPAMVRGNLASRLRSALLYQHASLSRALVVGTGDFDETYIGYTCKGTTADIFPITGLHKDEVRTLLRIGLEPLDAELAQRLCQRPASPGYWAGQDAEQEIGLSYRTLGTALDLIVTHCDITPTHVFPRHPEDFLEAVGDSGLDDETVLHAADLVARNYHKSFASPALWRPLSGHGPQERARLRSS